MTKREHTPLHMMKKRFQRRRNIMDMAATTTIGFRRVLIARQRLAGPPKTTSVVKAGMVLEAGLLNRRGRASEFERRNFEYAGFIEGGNVTSCTTITCRCTTSFFVCVVLVEMCHHFCSQQESMCSMGAYFGIDEHSKAGTRDTKKSIMQWMPLPSSPGLSSVAKLSSLFVQRAVQRYGQEQPTSWRNKC